MEFGLYVTVDGGAHWVKMAGVPTSAGARHHDPAARRAISSPARSAAASSSSTTTPRCATCRRRRSAERARLYPLRDAYQYNELGQFEATWGNTTYPQPALRRAADLQHRPGAGAEKMAIQIADDQGQQVRRIELTGDAADAGPAPHRVGSAPRSARRRAARPGRGGGGGSAAAAATPARRSRRRATRRRSGRSAARRSPRSASRCRSWWCRSRGRTGFKGVHGVQRGSKGSSRVRGVRFGPNLEPNPSEP